MKNYIKMLCEKSLTVRRYGYKIEAIIRNRYPDYHMPYLRQEGLRPCSIVKHEDGLYLKVLETGIEYKINVTYVKE